MFGGEDAEGVTEPEDQFEQVYGGGPRLEAGNVDWQAAVVVPDGTWSGVELLADPTWERTVAGCFVRDVGEP